MVTKRKKERRGGYRAGAGRKATGRTRPLIRPFPINDLENEYIRRKSYSMDMLMSEYIRFKTIPPNYKNELVVLRKMQIRNGPR